MLTIRINKKNKPEKIYTIQILLKEFLGLDFNLDEDSTENAYEFILSNSKKVIIKDHLWAKWEGETNYLNPRAIPIDVKMLISSFSIEKDLPVLYGNPVIDIKSDSIYCDVDIIAGSYFFLTRWEEYVINDFDEHGRFKYKNSLSYKFKLIHRPVVDEYTQFLWNLFHYLDPTLRRKKKRYKAVITHDIDAPLRLMDFRMLRNSFFRNLIKRKNYTNALRDLPVYFINKISPNYDLGYCYDLLMDASESIGVKSNFFFINSKKTKYDPGYDNSSKIMQKIFENIKRRGHRIGLHASYYSLENPELWKQEYFDLCEKTGMEIKSGRQHYLRFKVPFTWQIWDDYKLETDYTLGYAEMEGFRCGTCFSYPVFNFLSRKKLNLRESPLIFMEVSVTEYQKIDKPEEFEEKLKNIVNIVKKYNGEFVFLYHNSFFDTKYLTQKKYFKWIDLIK